MRVRSRRVNLKKLLKFSYKIIFFIIFSSSSCIAASDYLPTAPVNTCDVDFPVPPASNTANNQACQAAYQDALAIYQSNVQVWDYISSTDPGKKATVDANGKLMLPNAPVNNCNQFAPGSPEFVNCETEFTTSSAAYQKAQTAYDSMNSQISSAAQLAAQTSDLTNQQAGQEAAGTRLEKNTENSATSALQVVQNNNQEATSMYSVSATILSDYSSFNENEGELNSLSCSGADYDSCTNAVAGYAASAAFSDLAIEANSQIQDLGANRSEVCILQNKLSENKSDCSFTTLTSPVVIPAIANPPSPSWFDPFTSQCRPSAPELCKEILDVINGGGSGVTGLLPKPSRRCPDGGTSCVESESPIIEVTPNGVKYTFKNKKGKAYTFNSSDFKSEKSMIKAGLSPAQAKNLKKELEKKTTEVKVVAQQVSKQLTEVLNEKQGIPLDLDKKMVFKNDGVLKNKKEHGKSKDSEAAVSSDIKPSTPDNRRPSSEGLSRNLNGDLIGVARDDIFKMINRRYQRKSDLNWFYVP
jgi:hypothetical protein